MQGRSASSDSAVQVRGLTRRYGSLVALDGVDLEVPAGTVYAVVGPNGAGKTTLFHILTTLLVPTAGEARVFGRDVVRQAAQVRALVGVAFQEVSLDLDLPAAAVLGFHGRLYGLAGARLRRRVEEVARAVGLTDVLRRRVGTYSGGMRRRLELARALMGRPRLLVLDEPTSQLDPHSREAFWGLVRELCRQESVTVLFATHYLEEAEQVADRVAILDRGRVLAEGHPAELVRRLGLEVLHLRGEGPLEGLGKALERLGLARWWAVDGPAPGERLRVAVNGEAGRCLVAVLQAAQEHGVALREVSVNRPSLHELFLRLTARPTEG